MDRVISVGEISDHFWPPENSSKMNRSASEWAFQRFLQEASASSDVVEIKDNSDSVSSKANAPSFKASEVPADSDEYQAFLKSKLNLACAAVAASRAYYLKPKDSSARAESGSQASNTSQLGSHAPSKGGELDLSRSQDIDNGAVGVRVQKKNGVPVKSTTSGSSREQSDDDENEGETELTQSMDPKDAKRIRRMLSNRESARRSRRRKQAHLTELETQVSQLRVENSSLLKRLGDINHKFNEAAVDNRVLKADVETLRAKVKMAEETVKRMTGLHPMFHVMPDVSVSNVSIPSFDRSPSETSTDATVPIQNDPKHQIYQQLPNKPLAEISSVENVQGHSGPTNLPRSKMGRTTSLQRVASLEHLEKRMCGNATPPRVTENTKVL